MNYPADPAMATTTTSTTVTETHVQTNLRWDPGYIRTIPGILKVAQVVSLHMLEIFLICLSRTPLVFNTPW